MTNYFSAETFHDLRHKARQFENVQRIRQGVGNQMTRFAADGGLPQDFEEWGLGMVESMEKTERELTKNIRAIVQGTAMSAWVEETHGLGAAVFFFLGLLPPLAPIPDFADADGVQIYFANPAKLWRYCGLHPEGGRRRERGVRAGYSSRLKAYAIARLATPCEKQSESPFYQLYIDRKAHTSQTHPLMLEAGEGCETCDAAYGKTKADRAAKRLTRERTTVAADCAALGGRHWTPGHRRADALRVMAKAILLDAWRVANDLPPRVGATVDVLPVADPPSLVAAG